MNIGHAGGQTGSRIVAAFVAGALVGAVSAVQVLPNFTGEVSELSTGPANVADAGPVVEIPSDQDPTNPIVGDPAMVEGPSVDQTLPSTPGLACAPGRNGGATDTGVTGDRIRLASTVVQSGPGSTFLGASPIGMQAVVRIRTPRTFMDHYPFGSMGIGTPLAIGAAAAMKEEAIAAGKPPRPVVLVTGDGAFGFYPSEFNAAQLAGLKLICVISNDGGSVAFASFVPGRVPADDDGLPDVFLYDVRSASLTRVSAPGRP